MDSVYLAGEGREERIASARFQKLFNRIMSSNKLDYQTAQIPDWAKKIPSPIHHLGMEKCAMLWLDALFQGDRHLLILDWLREYGREGGNFLVPSVTQGWGKEPEIDFWLVVCNPADHKRLTARHVKKAPNYEAISYGHNLLGHYDVAEWRRERNLVLDAVMPLTVIQHTIPMMCAESRQLIANILTNRHATFNYGAHKPIAAHNIHELLAESAFKILCKGFFGELDDDFINEHSRAVRWALNRPERGFRGASTVVEDWCETLIERSKTRQPRTAGLPPTEGVKGPLLERIEKIAGIHASELSEPQRAMKDTVAIFSLAGHDTTATTMTFLCMELAKNRKVQDRLRGEVDALFQELDGREISYGDLPKMKFLTQCLNETLRLWTAVPFGSIRELGYDDCVNVGGEQQVQVPKGTVMMVHNFASHRNENSWGRDADNWNPNRWEGSGFADFTDGAVPVNFNPNDVGCPFSGRNPQSDRFHPFTRAPRDCIGKNVAQAEMRVVLYHLVRAFTFELAEPTRGIAKRAPERLAFQQAGILKPRDGMWLHFMPRHNRPSEIGSRVQLKHSVSRL